MRPEDRPALNFGKPSSLGSAALRLMWYKDYRALAAKLLTPHINQAKSAS
jgi:hypothetical protein